MSTRKEIISSFYDQTDEDGRLHRTRHGQLEYETTMAYIHRYADRRSKVLEIGAGTGRYSVALAKEGMDVTAVELTESNLRILKENSRGMERLRAFQGDATDLSRFSDDLFDVTLLLGPMYHLYETEEVNRAIDEAIRVTKPGGVLLFAFISVFGIMYANYFYGNWALGQAENFTPDYKVRHFKEQIFTGYDVTEFEQLFREKPVVWVTTAGVDGLLEPIETRPDFSIPDEDFKAFSKWYLTFSEKRELLGSTNHLLYICRKGEEDAMHRFFESENISFVEISELLIKDYLAMVNDVQNVGRFIGRTDPLTEEKEMQFIHRKLAEKAPIFTMIEKKSGDFIGNIELMGMTDTAAELGIAITAAKQELGFGTEAIKAIMEYGMQQLGLRRIFLKVYPDNARAIHVYEKCGFRAYARTDNDIFMEING